MRDRKSRIILIMKVLAILGSPRRGGNAETLLDKALEGVQSTGVSLEIEKVVLNELKFSPCQECGGCDKTGRCVLKDAMQDIYKKIDQADAVIISSPIFFGSLPAQVKAMIDRYQCRWVAKYILEEKEIRPAKKGLLILVEASARESFLKNAQSIIKNFFAVSNIGFTAKLYCPQVDKRGDILKDEDCLKRAFELGKETIKNDGRGQ
ncbi:MAG: flavodoxin family protein [Candidatus Omnitrophica bacterium]|nr:flavodoxin family protein [Candidatus Omnitrophota bacterium]